MKLIEAINWNIYNYPTLFRHWDWEKSAILVLDHMFLGYGTGLEWHPDGFLCECMGGYNLKHHRKTLPKGFFEKKLFNFDITKENKEKVHNFLKKKNVFHYFRRDCLAKINCVFEDFGDKNNKNLLKKFSFEENPYFIFLYEAECIYRNERHIGDDEWKEYHPHGMCKYSPVVEMTNGRTNSPHINDFDLTNIKKDWIEGAIKIVKVTLEYYQDPERFKYDFYYPNEKNIRMAENRLKDAIKEGREKEYRKSFGLENGETVKDRLIECWDAYIKEQLNYCNKFLEKYEKQTN